MNMTMNSRDRVLAAFHHQEPDRVPRWCGSSEEFWTKAKASLGLDDEGLRVRFGDDFRRVLPRHLDSGRPLPEGAHTRTVFGVERGGRGLGMPLSHPLQNATAEEIHSWNWPGPEQVDVSHVRGEIEQWEGRYAILGGDWSPYWHDAIDMLGMEELYILISLQRCDRFPTRAD